MIVVFPMLTDESISKNTLPGICKALEKFILIYEMDAIMKITGWRVLAIGSRLASSQLAKTKREDLQFELLEAEPIPGAVIKTVHPKPAPPPSVINVRTSSRDKKNIPKPGEELFDVLGHLKDVGTVKIDIPSEHALSVEPTWMTVTTTLGTRIIGVKVIPVAVRSQRYTLSELLVLDSSLKFIDTLVYNVSRKLIRAFWALCRHLRIPFLANRVISGDPEKDILWAQSFHKRNVFCLLNYADFSDSDIFKSAGGIQKLHSLGWNSFILADDVNKMATFCMKEFHGLCSSVSYQFIYSSLGKDHSKVYDSLEDLKKSASPFFKTSVNQKKLFGKLARESAERISKYLGRV